jgi:hypothetical protein
MVEPLSTLWAADDAARRAPSRPLPIGETLFVLAPPKSMLFRDRARFDVLGSLTSLFNGLIQNLIELPLFFLTGVGKILFHGCARFRRKWCAKHDGCACVAQTT